MHKHSVRVYHVPRAAFNVLYKFIPRPTQLQALLSFSTLFTPIPTPYPPPTHTHTKNGPNKVGREELVELGRLLEQTCKGRNAHCDPGDNEKISLI